MKKVFQLLKWGGLFFASLLRIKNYKIGFSIVLADEIVLDSGAKIGHFNIIICKQLRMGKGAKIGHFNYIHGNDTVFEIKEKARIENRNKFTGLTENRSVCFCLQNEAHIIGSHFFDLSDSITIGKYSCVAGSGTQFWTHSFFIDSKGKAVKVVGEICIGNCCYIGAKSCVLLGTTITDNVTVGAMSCVSKSLNNSGFYYSQPLRYSSQSVEDKIANLGNPILTTPLDIYKK